TLLSGSGVDRLVAIHEAGHAVGLIRANARLALRTTSPLLGSLPWSSFNTVRVDQAREFLEFSRSNFLRYCIVITTKRSRQRQSGGSENDGFGSFSTESVGSNDRR